MQIYMIKLITLIKSVHVCIKHTSQLLLWHNLTLFLSEAIHQRILLYNKLVIAWAINKLLYSKVLTMLLYSKVLTMLLYSKVIKLIVCQQLLIRHIQLQVLLSFIEDLGGK